ncbi:hypothetical protein [Arenimonas daejeonensis]|uniref:hypothetical protein n=1 Tax=Arenimonas daejeonensis TaxID=370777 RepID=UPI0011BED246|nr:hypothetical protein [Arenimonas daejeonensis]
MDDFEELKIEVVDKKKIVRPLFRDHGHELNVTNSYLMSQGDRSKAVAADYVVATGELFLCAKRALEENRVVTIFGKGKIG